MRKLTIIAALLLLIPSIAQAKSLEDLLVEKGVITKSEARGAHHEMGSKVYWQGGSRIDFAVFTFAQSSGIDEALIAAHNTGVRVRGILDKKQSNQTWAAKAPLVNAGIQIDVAGGGSGLGKVHHKLMTIDDQLTICGSFNYTGPANRSNDENILIIGDLDETRTTSKQKQSAIATAARKEIDRIRNAFVN